MRKIVSISFVLYLLFTMAGCANDQQAIYDEFADKPSSVISSAVSSETSEETAGELTGELHILKKYELAGINGLLFGIDLIAEEFEAMHPGVKITIEAGISDEEYSTTDETLYRTIESRYTQNLIAELMSGEAPDIIDMSGLSIPRYSESGLLCDLYSFGDFDDALPEDEYFTNMLKAAETDKGLFAIPIAGKPSWVWVNQEVAGLLDVDLKAMESINAQDVIDMFNAAVDGGLVEDSFVVAEGMTANSLFSYQYPDLLDEGTGQARFNTEEGRALLEGVKGLRFPRKVSELASYSGNTGAPPVFDKSTWLIMGGSPIKTDLVNYTLGSLKAEPIPEGTINGHRMFSSLYVYAISQNCQNKELAWEFLKFALSFNNIDENGKAICTAGLYEEGKTVNKSDYYQEKNGNSFLKRDTAQDALKIMMGKLYTDEIGAFVIDTYDKADTLRRGDPLLEDALLPVFTDYFDHDLLSTEQCAKRLQEKADIYLQE